MRTTIDFEHALRQRLESRFQCPNPIGCSESKIQQQLTFFPHDVGAIYRTFLRVCGVSNGGMFISGHNWKLSNLRGRNEQMRSTAAECDFTMPEKMFSFLDYIGDYFWCIEGGSGDDPAVVRFDLDEFVPMTDKLSTFLLQWEELVE